MPTLRQKRASRLLETAGSIGEAMRGAGYAPATAKNPKELTTSKGWNELIEKYLPDEEILTVHKKALHATKIHGSLTEPDRTVEDIPTQLKAVDLSYKVKGRLSNEVGANIQINVIPILGGVTK